MGLSIQIESKRMDRKRIINKRFIIVSGRVTRGGTLVLSAICKLLIDKGYDARMFYMNRVPGKETDMRRWWIRQIRSYLSMPYIRLMCALNKKSQSDLYKIRRELVYEPIKGLQVQYLPFFNKEKTIVVYPEIIYGNFLKAKHVVRYLLFHNKLYSPDDPDSFGKNDLFVAYRSIFNDPVLNPGKKNIIGFNWFDSNLYRQYNFGERTGSCYILRKGRNRPDCPKTFDGPVIDDGVSETDIVRYFNEAKYCYSYDPQTFYTTIAAVCGCIPIIVMEPGKSANDYLSQWENHYGQAYGNSPEQIQYAIDTRQELLKTLDYRESNERSINLFLDLVESHFSD